MKIKRILTAFLLMALCLTSFPVFNIPHVSAEPGPTSVASLTPAPIIFEETSNYIKLDFMMFVVEFYKGSAGYNKIYDGRGNVIVYDDRIVLEYLFKSPDTWKQRGTPIGITYIKHDNYHYDVTRFYDDYLGTTYNITYTVKSDSPMKITVNLTCGQTNEYRIAWRPSGIVQENWKQQDKRLVFGNELALDSNGWVVFDWEDVYQSFGDITDYNVETVANGKKANIYFNLGMLNAQQTVVIDPSIVGTSNTGYALYVPYQRKSFYAESRFWVFYSNGSHMVFNSSPDGEEWINLTVVRECSRGYRFSVFFDDTYVHYSYSLSVSGGAMVYRQGTPHSNGSITWITDEQTVDQETGYTMGLPMISVDSNGYPLIAYRRDTAIDHYPYVTKSSLKNGTWQTASGFPYQLTAEESYQSQPSVVPLTNEKAYAIYLVNSTGGQYGKIRGKLWNSSSWGSEENVTSLVPYANYEYSVVNEGDDVHFALYEYSSGDIHHVKRTYGVGWGEPEDVLLVGTQWGSYPFLTIDEARGELYCIWRRYPNFYHIYYKKRVDETWGELVDWITVTSGVDASLATSFYKVYDGRIGFVYPRLSDGGYNIYFAYLLIGVSSIGNFTSSEDTVEAYEIFTISTTITDLSGVNDFKNATLEISHDVIFKWDNATNVFSIYSDPNNYSWLRTGSNRTTVNSTTYRLSWRISLYDNYIEGDVSIIENNTKVYDIAGCSASGSYTNLFTFTLGEYSPPGDVTPTVEEPTPWEEPQVIAPPPSFLVEHGFELGVGIIIVALGGVAVYSQLGKPKSVKERFKRKATRKSRVTQKQRKRKLDRINLKPKSKTLYKLLAVGVVEVSIFALLILLGVIRWA